MNKNAVVATLLILITAVSSLVPLSMVSGQTSLGVNIYQLAPPGSTTSQDSGNVGQAFSLQGTIITSNGLYQVWLGSTLLVANFSVGYFVYANFTLPEITGGTYVLTLRDLSQNVNATQDFTINTAYSIKASVPPSPTLLQEGSSVPLNVNITGGQSNTAYTANIKVMLPAPLSTNYTKSITLTTNQKGTAQAQLTYPDATFQPADSLTNYTGSYQVFFNDTQGLATDQFFIGFTDSRTYHRGQSVTVRAIGYQPNENATIDIKNSTDAIVHSEAVTASSNGTITTTWTVPSNVTIGDYNITITPQNTHKLVPDSQIFNIPGYLITFTTLNLAGAPVSQILIEALDQATDTIYSSTSGNGGKAGLYLELGNHTVDAFWNGVKVGETTISITGENSFGITCQLTNLKIIVKDKNGFLIPFVNLNITYQYVTTKEGITQTGSASGQTDLSGAFVLNSTLPGISYNVDASLYGVVFNTGNNTISGLPMQAISEALILCPSRTLTLKILGYDLAAIPNARIELVELTSGIFYGAATDSSGNVNIEVTFGKYRLRVYAKNILLNETIVEVFSDTSSELRCTLYNIQLSVKVVDYFGQAIPKAHVVLNGPGTETFSATTQRGGTVKFNNVIGGSMQIIVYPAGMENSYQAVNLQVDEPASVQVKMAKYILLGSFLIETSMLASIIIILAIVIPFLCIEIYRRRRNRKTPEGKLKAQS